MTQKHTPGPRTVERDDGEDGEIYYAVHGQNYEFVSNFHSKADAHLDAAAPELLDALIKLNAECIRLAKLERNRGIAKSGAPRELYDTVQAAIAKATGDA